MPITTRPVKIAIEDSDGLLVFHDDRLIAVLSRLSEIHEHRAGHWFLEATFAVPSVRLKDQIFPDVEAAHAWIEEHLVKALKR